MNALQQAAQAERETNRLVGRPKVNDSSRNIHPSTHGHLHELGIAAVRKRLREAEEQLTYWSGARARALTERDRTAAGARIALWQMEIPAIKARLRQLDA